MRLRLIGVYKESQKYLKYFNDTYEVLRKVFFQSQLLLYIKKIINFKIVFFK